MSKKVEGEIDCPKCGTRFPVTLYRSVWIEDPAMRDLVFTDRINLIRCPKCGNSGAAPFSLLATNVKRGFAVWYEPYPDPMVDSDRASYARHFGPDSFYAAAPRIKAWELFKETILKFERGELVGRPPAVSDLGGMLTGAREMAAGRSAASRKAGCGLLLVGLMLGAGAFAFATIVAG